MEEGILSILRCGGTYQVRYASTNPYALDLPPVYYPDTDMLVAVLHGWGIDAWSIHQIMTTVQNGHVAVLPVHVTVAQLHATFPSHRAPWVGLGATDAGAQTSPPNECTRCSHRGMSAAPARAALY